MESIDTNHNTVLGISAALEAGAAVFFGIIGSLLLLWAETQSIYVACWCYQSIVISLVLYVIGLIFSVTGFLVWYYMDNLTVFYVSWGYTAIGLVIWISMVYISITRWTGMEDQDFVTYPIVGKWCRRKGIKHIQNGGWDFS
eukprot:TRINITY_DN261_c0_g2_i2.p2 TRINITY_DN261_c0_g2~~TRINITY_DN261_c0_g2_i2.p2  ORF type:complete len:142 (-),score=16.02 TRINITY_DN261_c0_g2_i2:1630-2055(-)